MSRPAPHLAARRRMLRLYPGLVAAGGALYLPNAEITNSGTVFGIALLTLAVLGAAIDADKTTPDHQTGGTDV